MISIVIPIYNVGRYLEECVNSVLSQTYSDLQIILVDDGSTDSSGAICDDFAEKDRRVQVIHKKNGGLSDARNVGTSAASGDFIFYLDSDDYLEINAIQNLLEAQRLYRADVVVGGYFYSYDHHETVASNTGEKDQAFNRTDAIKLLMSGVIQTFAWGKLIRTEIAKKHSFPVGLLFEDHFWTHLVFQDSKIVACISQPMVHYRQREDSISYTFTEKRLDIVKGWEARIAFLIEEYPEYLSMFLSRCARDTVMLAWLVLTRMKNNKRGFERLQRFAAQYHLEEHCDGTCNKLIQSLKRGRLSFGLNSFRYKIEEKLQWKKSNVS